MEQRDEFNKEEKEKRKEGWEGKREQRGEFEREDFNKEKRKEERSVI